MNTLILLAKVEMGGSFLSISPAVTGAAPGLPTVVCGEAGPGQELGSHEEGTRPFRACAGLGRLCVPAPGQRTWLDSQPLPQTTCTKVNAASCLPTASEAAPWGEGVSGH